MPVINSDVIGQSGRLPETRVALEPVFNLMQSLALLTKEDLMPGLKDWVIRTKEAMSLEERMRHQLVMVGLFHSFIPDTSWQSFAGYLDHLATCDPEILRDRMLDVYSRCCADGWDLKKASSLSTAERARILSSEESYLGFLTEHFHGHLDHDLEAQAYRYAVNPPALRELVVGHLRSVWSRYLEPEWTRVRAMLAESVNAFQAVDLSRMSRMEAVKSVTGMEPSSAGWQTLIRDAGRIVFVPNAHMGPYMGKIVSGTTLLILFGARLPEGMHRDTAQELTRTEIVTRLAGLADEGRLRILRMAADAGELRATDVMVALDISQSAASRHLTQLTANGYLTERRCEGGKCYSFNPARLAGALGAVSQYLRIRPEEKTRSQ